MKIIEIILGKIYLLVIYGIIGLGVLSVCGIIIERKQEKQRMKEFYKEPSEIRNCAFCKYREECYDRDCNGRHKPCNNPKEQVSNYKWLKLIGESPRDRKDWRRAYISLSKNINNNKKK